MTTQLTYNQFENNQQQVIKEKMFPGVIKRIESQLRRRNIAYKQIDSHNWEKVVIDDIPQFVAGIDSVSHYSVMPEMFSRNDGYRWSLRKR